jgi:2,3-bisphosphoglycerate-dependent phosphoglycerate mutase
MAKLFLFRHGQTTYNRDHVFTGWLDAPLTSEGKKQAKYIAKLLKDVRLDLAYQSRLSRSIDTLGPVLKSHTEIKQVITDDRIIERSYGDLAGHSHRAIIDKYGQEKFDLWHRSYNTPPPNGESFADVKIRVGKFIKDLKARYAGKDLNIAISAHGNSIRLFRQIMEKASVADTVSWSIPYDQIFQYDI